MRGICISPPGFRMAYRRIAEVNGRAVGNLRAPVCMQNRWPTAVASTPRAPKERVQQFKKNVGCEIRFVLTDLHNMLHARNCIHFQWFPHARWFPRSSQRPQNYDLLWGIFPKINCSLLGNPWGYGSLVPQWGHTKLLNDNARGTTRKTLQL